jgi:hypothetical protein
MNTAHGYAAKTTVSVDKSRAEIERVMTRFGATSFVCGWHGPCAVLMFEAKGRRLRFDLPIPDVNDKQFGSRSLTQRQKLQEQEARRRWRSLLLVIKAKLESIASGIETFDEAFLSHIVVPGGETIAEWAIPQIVRAYADGLQLPPLLGGGPGTRDSSRGEEIGS